MNRKVHTPLILATLALLVRCEVAAADGTNLTNLCVSNMETVRRLVSTCNPDGIFYPPSLSLVATNATNLAVFLSPTTGHQPGPAKAVDDWTDFIYVGSLPKEMQPYIPLLISPPENHGGGFGLVLWDEFPVTRASPRMIRTLIQQPWALATNASEIRIEELKRRVVVRIPPSLQRIYTNAYSFKRH